MRRENLLEWLKKLNDTSGDDLYLVSGNYPYLQGDTIDMLSDTVLDQNDMHMVLNELLRPEQHEIFNRGKEFNMSLNLGLAGRFRVNILDSLNGPGVIARRIANVIPSLNDLHLPELLGKLCLRPRGLILVVGQTGSGKSTSMASMLDYRNQHKFGHILTIEDPIEYLHTPKKAIITQREVGNNTMTFRQASIEALRQHPHVILLGEIRDRETMMHALNLSGTGHLVLATLHASNANQSIERILSFYSESERRQILLSLSSNLQCVLSQRLVHKKGGGRRAVHEIMLMDKEVTELVKKGDSDMLKAAIESKRHLGMVSFDQNLLELVKDGIITTETALMESDDPYEMEQKLAQNPCE